MDVVGQAKESKVPYYSMDQKRLLLMSTGNFIYGSSQGQFEQDSAYLFACDMYSLGRLLPYNEQYSDGTPTTGSLLIEGRHIAGAKNHLATLSGTDQIRLLLDLGVYYTFKSGTDPTDIDSGYYFLEKANNLSKKLNDAQLIMAARNLLGRLFFQKGDQQKSQEYLVSVINYYQSENDKKGLARALEMQAIHLPLMDTARLRLLNQSLKLYTELKSDEKQIEVLSHIATIKFFTDWQTAIKDLEQILLLQRSSGFRHIQYTLNVLAYICEVRSEYIKGLRYSQESVDVINELQDLTLASIFYLRTATFFLRFDKRVQAVQMFEKTLRTDLQSKTQIFWYPTVWMIAQNYTLSSLQPQRTIDLLDSIGAIVPPYYIRDKISTANARARAYQMLRNHEQTKKYYKIWSEYAEVFPIQFAQAELPAGWIFMGDYYRSIGDFVTAKSCLNKAYAIKEKFGIMNSANYYFTKASLDSADGNMPAALQDFKLYKYYDDSLRKLNHVKILDQLQVEFETEKKDKNIEILTVGLKEAALKTKMTLAGAGLLLIIVGLVYSQYRSKQKSNVLLEFQKKEINDKNTILTSLLQEKEWLLKEVHHRVKNNLQTVVSLLESQSYFLEKDALYAIQDCQNRVYSMSLIHQRLYQSENVESINLSSYIADLVGYLTKVFDVGNRIQFILSIQPIKLDISQAIPIGLILNEAITNSIKYAFPRDRISCQITIALEQIDDEQIKLSIQDNGIGLPADFESIKKGSLGIKLIKGLTADMQGSCEISSSDGALIQIVFIRHNLLNEVSGNTIALQA